MWVNIRSYPERMRAMGLRQIQVWIPDTRSEAFSAEVHRQSVAHSPRSRDDQAFIDAAPDPQDQ
jgi:Protein  of unknown function (DUF3018)